MLSLNEIRKFYNREESLMTMNIIKEYFQYKLLDYIFSSKYGEKLSFFGGTCIRIVYGSDRFSEDLDFDNFGLRFSEFADMISTLTTKFYQEGIAVETKNVDRGAYRCYFKIPKVLRDFGLSGFEEQKILIKIDTTYHRFEFNPIIKIINKFGIFQEIIANPADTILSQKIDALLRRNRLMVRDVYDIVTLYGFTKPNYNYLKKILKIKNNDELRSAILNRIKDIDLNKLSEEIRNFVSSENKLSKVKRFESWLETVDL